MDSTVLPHSTTVDCSLQRICGILHILEGRFAAPANQERGVPYEAFGKSNTVCASLRARIVTQVACLRRAAHARDWCCFGWRLCPWHRAHWGRSEEHTSEL